MNRQDLTPTPKFKSVMQEFAEGHLKSSSGAPVNSKSQAIAIGASETGQSYQQHKDQVRTMSKTVIPSSGKVKQPGKNEQFVKSGKGSAKEQQMTKVASAKHANPEFFKRQSDRKKNDQFPFQIKQMSRGTTY
jgi:hypothetical protein